jgi:hypothetical protein
MVGQPTPYAAGLDEDWVKNIWKGKVRLGSRAVVELPVGGTMGILQVSPNTMAKEAMDAKERQMVALGAKLIEQTTVQRTATEARQEYATEISVLGACSQNVAAVYVRAFGWCSQFATGAPAPVKFEIDPAFELGRMEAADRAALIADVQAGLVTWTEAREKYRAAGIATLDDAKAKAEIAADKPEPPAPVKVEPEMKTEEMPMRQKEGV